MEEMCPDRQIISLYLDGELPSPWKEKMETHLGTCPECRAALDGYRQIGESIKDLPDGTVEAARDRVWKKLTREEPALSGEKDGPPAPPLAGGRRRRPGEKRIWNRTVTLPLPAAVAAAVVIIIFVALFGIRGRAQSAAPESMMAAGIELDDKGTVPIQDMHGVIQYLSSQGNDDFMVIRLPESRRFSRKGEPALINAADYSRRRNSQ
jgi:anti-sigma factor RsiW